MSLIKNLDHLQILAESTNTGDDERRDTHENFEFAYALRDAWPKIRTFINESRSLRDTYFMENDALKSIFFESFKFYTGRLDKALAELDQP